MQVTYATAPTPGQANEDYVVAGPEWAFVLDGATKRADVDSGCIHGAGWLVRTLAGQLAQRLAAELGVRLPDLLAEAIKATCDTHADTCDLANPDSPSATVVMLRQQPSRLDWLVLADSPLVLDLDGEVQAVVDDRTARLPSYTTEAVRATRNSPGGFWVASTPLDTVSAILAVTDGVGIDDYRVLPSWPAALDLTHRQGLDGLLRTIHQAEARDPQSRRWPRPKTHDDKAAALVDFERPVP